jgi:flavin-binding protein dodecin
MGRPRLYSDDAPATAAQRQRAQRARDKVKWVEVSREGHDAHTARLESLQAAIHSAVQKGDSTAAACNSANVETMLERLTLHFAGIE